MWVVSDVEGPNHHADVEVVVVPAVDVVHPVVVADLTVVEAVVGSDAVDAVQLSAPIAVALAAAVVV